MEQAPLATWALIALAIALPCSLIALAGTAVILFLSRASRMAAVKRECERGIGNLASRVATAETNLETRGQALESLVRSLSEEAGEAFERALAERRRVGQQLRRGVGAAADELAERNAEDQVVALVPPGSDASQGEKRRWVESRRG